MAKKNKHTESITQLSLFENDRIMSEQNPEDFEDDFEEDDDELDFGDEPGSSTVAPKQHEFIPLKLLRKAIITQNPDDPIMADFAEFVLPNLLRVTIGVTAKGGKWIEKKLAEGIKSRRAVNDQSLSAHLLNGLFPANLIEQRLEKLNTTVKRVVKEQERRLCIAAFILHDFEKFNYQRILEIPQKYKDLQSSGQNITDLSISEIREIINVLIQVLKLDAFINPNDTQAYRKYLDDVVWIVLNTQDRWGTNWNLSVHSELEPKLGGDKLTSLSALSRLADRFASIIKHPQDALNPSINDLVGRVSDRQLKLSYHSIAENRGVLTNVVNNALIDAHLAVNTPECEYYKPLLYLPTGVVYLTHRHAPPINIESVPDLVISKIKSLCAGELEKRQTGFSRDGKGMKYADYYTLFFNDIGLMKVALKATLNILNDNKTPVSASRSENLVKFQRQEVLSADYNFDFPDDIRIDRLAEFGDAISRKIWGDKVTKLEATRKKREAERKKNKNLAPLPPVELTPEKLVHKVAQFWELSEHLPAIREIQRINERLKEKKLKGNTGGVPYEWYTLAAKYLEDNPGLGPEDVRPVCEQLINYISELIQPIIQQYNLPDGWDDLRLWVTQVVMLPGETSEKPAADVFLKELKNYQLAKKSGRGRQLICSVSHSPYTVTEQMESAVLFAPQVYTNKQTLGGSNAKRNISSIAGTEMMLRQILMSQTKAIGARFEEAKYRYLYFYPTYYCTPETNTFLHKAYDEIKQTRFDTGVRNHFINKDLQANFELERYQSVEIFHLNEETRTDKTFKLSYPEQQPLTFYFMALPPEIRGKKKPTDTESWIMPAWLALAFPMILDVKTVVSESPIPPFNDGAEFEESVFLDSAPPAIRVLTRGDRFRLDYVLEGWEANGKEHPAPLNALTAAYAIHLDVNAKQGKSYDPNWGKLTELAKDFETSPLYVFAYLNQWVRKQKVDAARIDKVKLYTYHFYPCFDPYAKYDAELEELIVGEKSPLNHPKKLTELYREFYRAKSSKGKATKANAILKPIDEAADVILKADQEVFQGEDLVYAVAARIFKLMDRVHASTAEGRWVMAKRDEERQKILDFARYFVEEVFEKSFAGDRARLAGRQLNLIRDTCEFLYRLENDKERRSSQSKLTGSDTLASKEEE